MRDGEYIALRMYKDALNARDGSSVYSMASALRDILFGDLDPIPKYLLDMGMEEAEKLRIERAKNPKKEEPQDQVIGGGIFTF